VHSTGLYSYYTSIKTFFNVSKKQQLARNTFWMFLGQGIRIPLQAVYFIFTARTLGAQGYGAFVGATALVAILAPFASLGCGNILIKNVSRDESTFQRYWGKALVLTLLSGTVLLLSAVLLSRIFLPATIPFALILSIAVADLVFSRLLDISSQAFQAFQLLARTSQLMILPNVVRLVLLACLLLVTQKPSIILWGYFYLFSVFISALVGTLLVHRELGSPVFDKHIIFSDLKEGVYFSVSLSSQNVYNDIDKTMLTKISTLSSAGIYAAAYRLIDVSFIPIRSLLYASYARFFQNGRNGLSGSLDFAKKLLPYALVYAVVVSACLFFLAPFLPLVLGVEFRETVRALQWLSLLPLLKVLHSFAADSLTGADFQGVRTFSQVLCAIFNVMLILWLVPIYSWRGAAWASLATDGVLAVVLWLVVFYCKGREKLNIMNLCSLQKKES